MKKVEKNVLDSGTIFKFIFSYKGEHQAWDYMAPKRFIDDPRAGRTDCRNEIAKSGLSLVVKYERFILEAVYPIKNVKAPKAPKAIEAAVAPFNAATIPATASDAKYYMPKNEAKILESAIERKKNIMLVGPSGCGKSRLVIEKAKSIGQKIERMPCTGGITDASFMGKTEVKDKQTYFNYGLLPRAMKDGAWLLIDEIDSCPPEYLFTLQAVLEGNDTPLTITDNAGELIYPHENFRIIATANTLGRGDTSGYHGTNMMNAATLDRWAIIRMTYSKDEPKMITAIVGDDTSKKIIEVASRIRAGIDSGDLPGMVLSTRRLIALAEAIRALPIELAIESELTGRMLPEERKIISEFIFDSFAVRI